jgi:hypothetical protein
LYASALARDCRAIEPVHGRQAIDGAPSVAGQVAVYQAVTKVFEFATGKQLESTETLPTPIR